MKRILIVLMVLAVAASAAWADRTVFIEGGWFSTSRSFTDGVNTTNQIFSGPGVAVVNFIGSDFGLLSTSSFAYPTGSSLTVNGADVPVSLDGYDSMRMAIEALMGPGYWMQSSSVDALFGVGVHFNGLVLMSSDYYVDPWLSYVLGPGAIARAIYAITDSLFVSAGATAAYDLVELMHVPDLSSGIDFKGGISWSISAGFGFKF